MSNVSFKNSDFTGERGLCDCGKKEHLAKLHFQNTRPAVPLL